MSKTKKQLEATLKLQQHTLAMQEELITKLRKDAKVYGVAARNAEQAQDALARRHNLITGISQIYEGYINARCAVENTETLNVVPRGKDAYAIAAMISHLVLPTIPVPREHLEINNAREAAIK